MQPQPDDGEDELPQSSKRRRTRREVEDAEHRRLEKSLSLYQLPSDAPCNGGSAQSAPAKRLCIDATPLLRLPTNTDSHSKQPLHSHSKSSSHSFVNSSAFFEARGNSPPRTFEPHCVSTADHNLRLIGSDSGSVVACLHHEEGNPGIYRHRPPKVDPGLSCSHPPVMNGAQISTPSLTQASHM